MPAQHNRSTTHATGEKFQQEVKFGVIRHCEGTDKACHYQQEVQPCVDTRLQKHRPHQHVEVDGSLWHNHIVFGDGEIVDPGGGRELAQRDLGNLLPFMAFPLLFHHLVPIACNIHMGTVSCKNMHAYIYIMCSDISICARLQAAQNSRNNSMIAQPAAGLSTGNYAQTV